MAARKHEVVEVRALPLVDGLYPEVAVAMASGRTWTFRMTDRSGTTKTYFMNGGGHSARPTQDHASEYRVAREAAENALARTWLSTHA